jgi:hypothetical protein
MNYLSDGDEEDLTPDNAAGKMMASFSAEKPKPEPGRPIAVDDGRLWGARDHLVWLFEETWADVGGRLPWIKKPGDLLEVLQVWNNPNNSCGHHYIAKTLLRPTSTPATPRWLVSTRRQLGKLNEAVLNASRLREHCSQSLETAHRAMGVSLSNADKVVVLDQILRRREKLAASEAEYSALESQQRKTQDLVLDGEAFFARSEFLRFCRSNRYRLEPLNLANALAGLPYIGWRQSVKRCRPHPGPGAEGQSMQIFRTVSRIVRTCVRRSDLVGHAERWLKSQKGKQKSLGVSKLREKWYYLRWSIKTVIEAQPRVVSRDLPFAITREFWKRTMKASDVDRLFEEEDRIAD